MIFREEGGRPNDERGFIHKKLLSGIAGVAKGFITGGPLGAVTGGISGFVRQPTRSTAPRSTTARSTVLGGQQKDLGRELKFGNQWVGRPQFAGRPLTITPRRALGTALTTISRTRPLAAETARDCPRGTVPDPEGRGFCVSPKSPLGKSVGLGAEVGDAVMGQFGAALEPGVQMIERSVCLSGMQLAKDGLCYNKGAITNSQRMWPRGRRPLLTGGDMRAITIAARAGGKLDRTTKRLRAMGMMKALPKGRGGSPGRASRLVVGQAGHAHIEK